MATKEELRDSLARMLAFTEAMVRGLDIDPADTAINFNAVGTDGDTRSLARITLEEVQVEAHRLLRETGGADA